MSDLNMKAAISAFRTSPWVAINSDDDGINMVTDGHIILILTDDQLWQVQAELKLKDVGQRYWRESGKLIPRGTFPPKGRSIVAEAINADNTPLTDTGLSYMHGHGYFLSCLVGEAGYVFIQRKYLLAIKTITSLLQAKGQPHGAVLVNGRHMISPVRMDEENFFRYLKPLERSREVC